MLDRVPDDVVRSIARSLDGPSRLALARAFPSIHTACFDGITTLRVPHTVDATVALRIMKHSGVTRVVVDLPDTPRIDLDRVRVYNAYQEKLVPFVKHDVERRHRSYPYGKTIPSYLYWELEGDPTIAIRADGRVSKARARALRYLGAHRNLYECSANAFSVLAQWATAVERCPDAPKITHVSVHKDGAPADMFCYCDSHLRPACRLARATGALLDVALCVNAYILDSLAETFEQFHTVSVRVNENRWCTRSERQPLVVDALKRVVPLRFHDFFNDWEECPHGLQHTFGAMRVTVRQLCITADECRAQRVMVKLNARRSWWAPGSEDEFHREFRKSANALRAYGDLFEAGCPDTVIFETVDALLAFHEGLGTLRGATRVDVWKVNKGPAGGIRAALSHVAPQLLALVPPEDVPYVCLEAIAEGLRDGWQSECYDVDEELSAHCVFRKSDGPFEFSTLEGLGSDNTSLFLKAPGSSGF